MLESLGHHNPTLDIPFRYLRILCTTLKFDSFGLD